MAIFLLAFPPKVLAADVRSISASQQSSVAPLMLEDAIALAVRDNWGIQSTYLQRIAQKFDLYVAEGKFFPKFILTSGLIDNQISGNRVSNKDFNTSATLILPTGARLAVTTSKGLGAGSGNSYSTSITLAQPLLKNAGLDVNLASVRVARLDEQINRLSLKSSLSQTISQVIYAYRELLRAQDQRNIAVAALQRGKELYAVNKALIAAGRMAEVDIVQTEADVASREVAVEEAENQIDTSRLALLTLLAVEPRTPVVAIAPRDIRLQRVDLAQALETALAVQPDYQIALLQVEKSTINLDYAKNQRLWDVSLVAGKNEARGSLGSLSGDIGTTATQDASQKYDSSYAGLQLTVPLGDRTIEQAVVHASVDLKSQNIKVAEARQVLEQRIRDAVRNVQTRWRQLELSRKASELSVLKLNTEREKLRVGRSSNFQVLSFESDLRNAENARVNAEIAYLNAQTDLDERMGKVLETWNVPIIEPEYAYAAHEK
jgi:outer membrane protein TolC